MAFDGTEWVGVDEFATDGFRDPADTALANRLASNQRWIEASFDRCGLATLIDGGEPITVDVPLGRPLASVQETTWLYVPLDFDRKPDKVEVILSAQAQTQGSSAPSVEIWAYLEAEEFTVARQHIISEDSDLQPLIAIEFDDLPATRPQSCILRLTVRSLTATATGTSRTQADAYSETLLYVGSGAGTPYVDELPSAQQPTTVSKDAQITSRGFAQRNDGADHALSMQNAAKFGSLANRGIELAGSDARSYAENGGLTNFSEITRAHVSYLMARNVTLRIGYDAEYFRKSELRSNIQELADVNRRLIAVNTRQWERPRLVSIGEEGRRLPSTSTELWPTNYRSMWRHADRDNTGTEIVRIACAPEPDFRSAKISVVLAGIHLMEPPIQDTAVGSQDRLVDQLMRQRTTAGWLLTAQIEQLVSGTTLADHGTTEERVVIDHVPCSLSRHFPLLQSAYFQRFWASASDYRFTYREGQLYGGDLRFLEVSTLTVRPTGGLDLSLPFDLVVYASPTSTDPIYRTAAQSSAGAKPSPEQYFDDQYVRLLKVGHSAYLRR